MRTKFFVLGIFALLMVGTGTVQAKAKKTGPWAMDAAVVYKNLQKSGKPAVLHFWAPWCQACMQMHKHVEAFYNKNKGKAVFVLVDIDDPRFEHIVEDYDAYQIPITVFENKKRKVVSYIEAFATGATMEKGLKMALK